MSADASAPAADLEYRWTRAYEAPDVSGSRWSHSHVFYPVFPPDKSAERTLSWITESI